MRQISDDDLKALVALLEENNHARQCRFPGIDPEVLEEAVVFYKKFNAMIDESGKIIWKTVLVGSISGLLLLIGLGAIAKIKEMMGQ